MLVLSRKVDEGILIGEDIMLTISKIKGNKVVVGIDAPIDVSIRRGENVHRADEGESESRSS